MTADIRSDPVAFLKDLERPEAYPAPRPTTIHLIATHISWVFITDHDVWKVKRPVDYGFVDYTTLERRRHFCHEEVRVNKRLAPDVYLDVVPICLQRGRHSFTSNGTIVDYAVRMRRLEEAAKFVPLEQLALSPQCGFASTEEGNILTEDEQWAKLRLVVEIADEVWGR